MSEWLPIRYVDFYDVPRLFAVEAEPVLLFESRFDDEADEYAEQFRVFRLAAMPSTSQLGEAVASGEFIGEVPVDAVRFDETRRAAVHRSALDAVSA